VRKELTGGLGIALIDGGQDARDLGHQLHLFSLHCTFAPC
jgi:hypothetical protein